jgi:penicillin amidase
MRPSVTAVSVIALCARFAAACGDDGEGGGRVAPPPTATAAAATATPPPTAILPPATATPSPSPTTAATRNPVLDLPVDATIEVPGLGGVTDVAVDSLGMPHIYAPDSESAVFVQGYETAKARFWEMDAFRRVAEGRLSELFGALTVATDIQRRTNFTTRDGRRLEEVLWERAQRDAPDTARLAEAYARGVNAWLADLRAGRNGATLPPEYGFAVIGVGPEALADWRPQDTIAIGRLQAFELSQTLGEEIEGAESMQALPEPIFRDIFRSAPVAPATVLPPRGRAAQRRNASAAAGPALPPRSVLRAARAHLSDDRFFHRPGMDIGSNNWIVAPALSTNGHAMLANDPHLALFNPPIWHMVQLDASDAPPVTGVQFPGLVGIILGHNSFGAWGGTVAVFDVTDVYVEQITTPPDYPASPRTVLFRGAQVPVLRVEEPIHVRGGDDVIAIIEVVPHHGPMVPDPNIGDDVVGLAATGMSFRWTGHEITLDLRFLTDLTRARNVEEFKAAVRFFGVGAQNWVWADVNGDIAYFPYTLVPQRPSGVIPYLPVDGTGSAEWLTDDRGDPLWLPEEKFPQATNPPEGFLATANNDQLGNTLDNDPLNDEAYFTFTADIGFREQRIQDLLSNRTGERPGEKIEVADMSRYQYDTASLEAGALLPYLFAAADNRPELVTPAIGDALARLRAWGEQKPGSPAWHMTSGIDPAELRDDVPPRSQPVTDEERADAVASSIYVAWSTRLSRAVYRDDFAGTGVGTPGGDFATKGLVHILADIDRTDPGFVVHTKGPNGESTLWDDKTTADVVETRDEILLGALADGLTYLEGRFRSADPEAWLWGRIHRVRFQHFFGQAGLSAFDLGPFAAPGGRDTVNPAGFSLNADDFTFSGGPSKRFVAVLDPAGVRSFSILPGGNNGNPGAETAYNRINPDIHYGDHVPGWLNGETFEYRVSRDAVAADTQLHLRYVPAGS